MLCLAIKGKMKLMSPSVMCTPYPWAAEIALSCASFISPRFLPLPSPLVPIFRKVESISPPSLHWPCRLLRGRSQQDIHLVLFRTTYGDKVRAAMVDL